MWIAASAGVYSRIRRRSSPLAGARASVVSGGRTLDESRPHCAMRTARPLLASQLQIYRRNNLRRLAEGGACDADPDLDALCQAVAGAARAACRAVGHVDVADYVSILRGAGSKVKEEVFRNTSPDDMSAAKFDLSRAMQSFNKLKDLRRGVSGAQSRADFCTIASNRIVAAVRPPVTRVSGRPAGPTGVGTIVSVRSAVGAIQHRRARNLSSGARDAGDAGDAGVAGDADQDGRRKMAQNAVPADRLSRAATIAGLMVNVASTTAKGVVQRYVQGQRGNLLQDSMASDDNAKLLVECLCKMRGTALKFGQLLSLQYGILPESVRKALVSVRHRADVMPEQQVVQIMARELGAEWRSLFSEFSARPMASASLGQVHSATTPDGRRVCVKVQFPGIADSIDSDVANLMFICSVTNVVPKRFFVKQFATELKVELKSECDYHNEAEFYRIFRQLTLDGFLVPQVLSQLSTQRVITTEFVRGVPIEDCKDLPQHVRDSIGDRLLRLSLSELFVFGLMNTDPNPSNYLYDEETDLIGLIDFGSCRTYSERFVAEYHKLVKASVDEDLDRIRELSFTLGFLNGQDSDEMIRHHVESVLITGAPFRHEGRFDFGAQDIIQQCRDKASIILKIRQQPPPPEVYSLHRKLAGCYVICQLIGARVVAREIFKEVSAAR